MKAISILFIFISTMGLSQFSPIWTVNNNFSQFEVRAFEMNSSGEMLMLTDQYDGGPTSNIMAYSSLDFGQTWDSTLFYNFYAMRDNAVITEGGKMYFASVQNVFPTGATPGYQRKVLHSSLDGGNTWEVKTIDSIFGANFERSISFLNDSTGMFFYNGGKYLTNDYGNSWQKISNIGAEHLGVLDDRFIFYWFSSAMTVNPFTNQIDSIYYEPFCEGNVKQSFFNDNIAYRMILGQNGQVMGPQYYGNFASLNIDELPLGDQRVIHFPENSLLVDIDATESCIHLVLSGRYVRSCDGGDTFYNVDAFNGDLNEQVFYMDFINDTLGFVVTVNQITYECRLWETTNGGGQNLTQILTNQSLAGIDETEDELSFTVYPNPVNNGLTIESKEQILKIELYSMEGKLILSQVIGSKSGELVLSQLSKGPYVVKVFTSSGVGYSKIVRE